MARFVLVRRLAIGPTAEVFLANTNDASGEFRTVAVKRLLPSLAEDARVVKRFWREARLAMAVRHNNLVQVLDYGTDEDGGCSMVMEFVDGADLRAILEGSSRVEGGIGLREAGAITLAVVDALAYLHSARDSTGKGLGLIHRNVNPANVIISRRGEVKLGDLGLARLASDAAAQSRNTVVAKEQANYLSPEQAMARKLDQRADIFLAGLLFYELISGSPLFQGPSPLGMVRGFDTKQLPELPEVPPQLRAVLEKALARDPAARYQTAREMGDDLGRFLEARRLRARPEDLAALLTRSLPGRAPATSLGSDEHAGALELTRPSASPERRPVVARQSGDGDPPPPPLPAPQQQPHARPAEPAASAGQKGSKKKLGQILVEKGRLDQDQLDDALARQKRDGGKLGEHLRSEGVSEITLIRAMSLQSGVPFVTDDKLDATAPPRELLKRLPRSVAQRLAAVPLLMRGEALFIAMMSPTDAGAVEELRKVTRAASVQGVFATEGAIDRALQRFYPLPQEDAPGDEDATGVVDIRSLERPPGRASSGPAPEPAAPRTRTPAPPPVNDTDPGSPAPSAPVGEGSPERKLLEGTLRMLGGVAVEGRTLGALAQRLASRLGAPPPEEDRAYLAGIALAVAVKFEGRSPFERPSRASLRAVFGQELAGLGDALSHATRDLTKGGAPESPLPAAVAAAAAFVEAAGSAAPTPDIASFALSEIEDDERISKAALAALGTLVAEAAYRG